MASSFIVVPTASTVTMPSVGVHSFPSTSEVDTSPQDSSTKVTMSSEDVSPASPASEIDTFSQVPSAKGGNRKKRKDNREKQKKVTIYAGHTLWAMAGQLNFLELFLILEIKSRILRSSRTQKSQF